MEKKFVVELRNHFRNGDGEIDYNEEDYQFATRSEAKAFAQKNRGSLHAIYEYDDKGNFLRYVN